jgi:2-polyprenyl-3-methyl-5-hydroxy-6-metoxy-1,4-benzoquinol methylase
VPEEMDDPSIAAKEHLRALQGLERINAVSLSAQSVWAAIEPILRKDPQKKWRVLDIATGAGDVPIHLWRLAARRGIPLEVEGCDKSPQALDFARTRAREKGAQVRFFTLDIHTQGIPEGYDILLSSLFLHHLEDGEAVAFLRGMAQKTRGLVLVNDLSRGLAGLLMAFLGTRLLSASPVVHEDGVRSARAAFSLPEIRKAARQAGMNGARIVRRWPSRFLLVWAKGRNGA